MQTNDNLDLTKLSIGLIGCGRWGRYILRDLKSLGTHVHVVARGQISKNYAKDNNADVIVDNIENLSSELDGYIVATTTSSHFEDIMKLVNYNKPIFVEKPLSISSRHIQELIDTTKNQIFVMHKWRYHSAINAIKKISINNSLGKIKYINTIRNQKKTPHTDVSTNWIHLPHDLSIILHLLGDIPPPQHAYLYVDNSQNTAGIHAVLGKKVICNIEHNMFSARKIRNVVVYFEEGCVELIDPLDDFVMVRNDRLGTIEKLEVSTEMPLYLELKAFLGFIVNESAYPMSSLDDELKIIEVIEELLTLAKF